MSLTIRSNYANLCFCQLIDKNRLVEFNPHLLFYCCIVCRWNLFSIEQNFFNFIVIQRKCDVYIKQLKFKDFKIKDFLILIISLIHVSLALVDAFFNKCLILSFDFFIFIYTKQENYFIKFWFSYRISSSFSLLINLC